MMSLELRWEKLKFEWLFHIEQNQTYLREKLPMETTYVRTWAWVGVYLKRFPSGLLLFRAVDCCDHGSALESNRYPLILSGPHEHDSLLPIFFNRPPKGAFLAARSRAPNLFRVSWLHLKFRKFVENVHFGVGFRI